MTQRITIDPVTRLEGHARIEIFLNDQGDVENAYFIVPELRGFEQFCIGRAAEDMPNITNRICGICPEAHHIASTKALDDLYNVEPPATAKKLRELLYCAFFVVDHTTHFYALGGPDFIVGPDAPVDKRNFLGVIQEMGKEGAAGIFACRKRNNRVIEILGGRAIHPNAGLPGGWSKPLTEKDRVFIETVARDNVDFALFSLRFFEDLVLNNKTYAELFFSDLYYHETYYMGTVDQANRANFYDGSIRIVSPAGDEFARYAPKDYREHIAEHVEPWTYLKFPYLKKVGWKGLHDGVDSGIYCATPLARLNVADGMATPRAQEYYEKLFDTFKAPRINNRYQPIHHRLATHWARLIEMLSAAERMLELARDPEIIDPHVRTLPTETPVEGVGCVEAPRGTLIHHYRTDEQGVLTGVNLVVGTTNNYAAIALSVKKAATHLIKKGTVIKEGLLNRIEMAFRLYDPCFSCATHALPGEMPLEVVIKDVDGRELTRIARH